MTRIIALVLIALSLPLTARQGMSADETDPIAASVEALVAEIKGVLVETQNELNTLGVPQLSKVHLELQTTFSEEGSSGFDLFIISAGAKMGSDRTQRISLELVPPPPGSSREVATSEVLGSALKAALLGTAKGVARARSSEPDLVMSSLEAQIRFVVTKGASANAKFQILPLGVDLGGEVTSASIQIITIRFDEP